MSLQRDINKKLDEILNVKAELIKLKKELNSGASMKNIHTGKKATKKDAINAVSKIISELEKDLSALTNKGKNVKGLFNNDYYVNDVMQDKQIVKELEEKKLGIKKPVKPKTKKPKEDSWSPPSWDDSEGKNGFPW
jgi:predicted translin family RNA/ssDNA-binding protein